MIQLLEADSLHQTKNSKYSRIRLIRHRLIRQFA